MLGEKNPSDIIRHFYGGYVPIQLIVDLNKKKNLACHSVLIWMLFYALYFRMTWILYPMSSCVSINLQHDLDFLSDW